MQKIQQSPASSPIFVLGVAEISPTTSASVFQKESHEPRLPHPTEKVTGETLPSAGPVPIPCVKPDSPVRHVLLLASDSAFESEVREALEMQQRGREPPLFFS